MATLAIPRSPAQSELAQPVSSLRFDGLVAVLSLWMVAGMHLDAWAHHRFDVETFFTPWHAVLYTGFLAVAAVLLAVWARSVAQHRPWQRAMPVGYELSLVGVLLFLAGGAGDMLWHMVFGIEVDLEALLSPTHLLLATGGVLIGTGPIRAAWRRTGVRPGLAALLPALVSLAVQIAVFSFFTAYANPLGESIFAQGRAPLSRFDVFLRQSLGVSAILLHTVILMGPVLFVVRRWTLPPGSLTLVFGLASVLTLSIHEWWQLAPFAIVAGLAADELAAWLRPSSERPRAFRGFAIVVPVIFFALYLANLALTGPIWWRVHTWAGVIFMAGILGYLLSYAFVPPAVVE